MDEKVNLQDIIRLLAEKKGLGNAKAEAFVKAFFSIIEDALKVDKAVKIKGFGTFKLTSIDSRESVDVNTGQRITIKDHTRITFVPDPRLRDLVNKPFSHFEAVVLHEGVNFDDVPVATSGNGSAGNEAEAAALPGDAAVETAAMPEEAPSCAAECEPDTGEPAPSAAGSPQEEEPSPSAEKKKRRKIWLYASGTVAALAVAVAVFLSTNPVANTGTPAATHGTPAVSLAENHPAHPAAGTLAVRDSSAMQPGTSAAIDTTRTLITGVRKNAATVIADSTSYVIVGTMATYRLKPGETLTMVSKRFYETKDLWPYLVMHNRDRIRNPHQVPQGILLRIPALRDKPQRGVPQNH